MKSGRGTSPSYYLYVILDIYSRCVVGWMLAHRESSDLAKQLIETTIEKQDVPREQLILHSDRGPSMTSHSVAQLLGSLGVTKSHRRPHVSNDEHYHSGIGLLTPSSPALRARRGNYRVEKTNAAQSMGKEPRTFRTRHSHTCKSSPNVATLPATSTLNTRVMPKKIPGFQGLAPDHAGCSN